MTRCLLLLAVSTLVASTTGCHCGNWFRSPAVPMAPAAACGVPPTTAAMPIAPVAPTPAGVPAAVPAPGYGVPANSVPVLPAPQGYVPAPGA